MKKKGRRRKRGVLNREKGPRRNEDKRGSALILKGDYAKGELQEKGNISDAERAIHLGNTHTLIHIFLF